MKNTLKKIFNLVSTVLLFAGYFGLLASTVAFAVINRDGLTNFTFLCILASVVFALLPILFFALKKIRFQNEKAFYALGVAACVLDVSAFVALISVTFSPLTHSGIFSVLALVFSLLTVIGILCAFFAKRNFALTASMSVFLICLILLGACWGFLSPTAKYSNVSEIQVLFKGGENGYNSYRIPSLVCLNKEILAQKLGVQTDGDVLVAFSEGRRNSSSDEGQIDMTVRYSFDSGKNWSDMSALLKYTDRSGKYGNPTPIFDKATGLLHLIYITATEESNYKKYGIYQIVGTVTEQKSFEWSRPQAINFEGDHTSLICGPNKGVCLSDGRLAFACYAEYPSKPTSAFVVFSSDHGQTWSRSDIIGEGNECDVVELGDSLLFVLRDNMSCTSIHPNEYQRFFISTDGGETWKDWETETSLATPICQCSLNKTETAIYLTYPNSHYSRADLSVAFSTDGKKFDIFKLYDGPSGYSSAVTLSDGSICVLAETGRINYAEQLTFMKLKTDK